MSTSRIFRAFLSSIACFAALAAIGSSAKSSVPAPGTQQGPVVLKVPDRNANFGGSFKVQGKTGNPYKGQVRVQAKFAGRWQTMKKFPTDARGRFQGRVPARANTSLRVKTNDERVSPARRVAVIGHLKLSRIERYVRIGRTLVVRGTVVPRGVRTIRMRVKGIGVVTTRSRSNGRFALSWKPRSNGDYRFRVRAMPSSKSTGALSRHRKISALRPGHASYYGPGLYGNGVACGGTLTPSTRGVAHKTLPCGTKVTLQYGDRTVVARVIDRGPYIAGRDWDLTEQTRNDLGFGGVGVVWTNK